jgi:leader peptidase (prepilin peptidase)/N-methyltransferase
MIFYLLFSLLCGTVTDVLLCRFLQPRFYPFTVLISAGAAIVLCMAFDEPISIIKGLFFAQTLIFIGFIDAKTHQIPNMLLTPVFFTGLIQFQPAASIEGSLAVFIPLLIAAMLSKGGIGGGDVKLMAAVGFLLGPYGVIVGTLIGFTLFLVICPFLYQKGKAYAMAPYLGIGCFLAYVFLK